MVPSPCQLLPSQSESKKAQRADQSQRRNQSEAASSKSGAEQKCIISSLQPVLHVFIDTCGLFYMLFILYVSVPANLIWTRGVFFYWTAVTRTYITHTKFRNLVPEHRMFWTLGWRGSAEHYLVGTQVSHLFLCSGQVPEGQNGCDRHWSWTQYWPGLEKLLRWVNLLNMSSVSSVEEAESEEPGIRPAEVSELVLCWRLWTLLGCPGWRDSSLLHVQVEDGSSGVAGCGGCSHWFTLLGLLGAGGGADWLQEEQFVLSWLWNRNKLFTTAGFFI